MVKKRMIYLEFKKIYLFCTDSVYGDCLDSGSGIC